MNKIINREEDNIEIYEGYSEEDILNEEEEKENDSIENNKNEKNENQNEEKKEEDKNEIEIIDLNKNNKKPVKHIYQIKDTYTENTTLKSSDTIYYIHTTPLQTLNFTPQKMLSLCDEIIKYFKIYIPKVISGGPKLVLSKYSTSITKSNHSYQILYNNLHRVPSVIKYLSLFKTIKCPDRKLVEYDSGKLIRLAELLKDLYMKKSKCLIFTQMTRMLDILEIFLNVHGFTYVRLDGSTKVELRQQIVDKFNTDLKVFCFISSTRSGGIGLNLTGADSIIFYDTDWNPAMDKQAQDRCHRIGQTRTVNIYRLITLSTIEENIFKKSIQKRELNYVVMEDGKFDSENISKLNLKNIIAEGNLIRKSDAENDNNIGIRNKNKKDDKVKSLLEFENLNFDNIEDQKNIEQMLIKIEDQEDVQAMKNLSKEMLDEYEKEKNEEQFFKDDDNKSNKKLDLKDIKEKEMLDKLKPIDKFSLSYFKEEYPYKQFVKDKEAKMNYYGYKDSDNETNTNMNEDEDIDIGNESESDHDSINKMDIDRAYDLYLKKKNEIMKMFEQMETEENNIEENNLNI
jgi:E1A-binding protein p400